MCDAGYDVTRLAFVLADLPVQLLGRIRSDRVMLLPAPPRRPGVTGRPPRHGGVFDLKDPASWPKAAAGTVTDTASYGRAEAGAWDRLHPRLTHRDDHRLAPNLGPTASIGSLSPTRFGPPDWTVVRLNSLIDAPLPIFLGAPLCLPHRRADRRAIHSFE